MEKMKKNTKCLNCKHILIGNDKKCLNYKHISVHIYKKSSLNMGTSFHFCIILQFHLEILHIRLKFAIFNT